MHLPVPGQFQANGGGHVPYVESIADTTQAQWLFTPAELLKSPSVLEGLSVDQELANRQKGVNFITQVGIMLKLPQLTLATASVFLHRFYMRYPMQVAKDKGIHHYQVAATALFLATKVEENCRKMKELIVACCRVAQKDPNSFIDEQSKEYWKWRDTILYHEDLLLEALCFDLQLEKPYRILFDYLCYYGVQDQKNLRNTSWAFLNDSHITTMCLLYSPKTIAGAALYAGVKLVGITLPDNEQARPWWEHLDLDIVEMHKACNQMADVYENPNIPRKGQKDAYTRDDDIISFERTRHTQSPSFGGSPAHSARSMSQGVKRDREDSWGHEQKNGHTGEGDVSDGVGTDRNEPLSKRQRNNSGSIEVESKLQRTTEGAQNQGPEFMSGEAVAATASADNTQADKVQQRIDAIVNGTVSKRTNHSHLTDRRVENQDQSLNESVARKPSRALESPNSQSAGPGTQQTTATQNGIRRDASQNPQHLQSPSTADSVKMTEDAKETDYGSEEGEV